MNDINIYKKKAKKYKYKYLKLKNLYSGEGGVGFIGRLFEKKNENNENNEKFKFIGSGGFGCIISPPVQFNTTNINNILYPLDKNIDEEIFKNKDYIGKLLSCRNNVFTQEKNEFLELEKIDPEAKYRSKIIFAAYYNKKELTIKLKKNISYFNKLINVNDIDALYNCLNNKKLLKELNKIDDPGNPGNANDNYGYIISTRVGISFDKINLNKFNEEQIIKILTNLKTSIQDLIKKLYDNEFKHGDLKNENITLDEANDYKISFIDFGLMSKYSDIKNIGNYSVNYQYNDIIGIFIIIINYYKPFYSKINIITNEELISLFNSIEMTKSELLAHFDDLKYKKKRSILPNILSSLNSLNSIQSSKSINFIDYSHFFKSIDDNKHNLEYFYTNCIKPIAKNIDIYALSLFIYQLFFKINNSTSFNSKFIKKDTRNILYALLKDALYNNIDGPDELIIYLDEIINSLDGSYIKGQITEKIRIRRLEIQNEILEFNILKQNKNGTPNEKIINDENICTYINKDIFTVPFINKDIDKYHNNEYNKNEITCTNNYKKYFDELSLKLHPDINICINDIKQNKVTNAFQKIQKAYELCNEISQQEQQ